MSRSSERELGDKWAEKMRREGCFVQKLPASVIAGIPDWLLVDGQTMLIEAKRRSLGRLALRPNQLTGAQHYFLRQVQIYGGNPAVLVLGEEGFVLVNYAWSKHGLSQEQFELNKESYE